MGSGVLASALAMDKVKSKQFFSLAGLPTPDYAVVHRGQAHTTSTRSSRRSARRRVVKPANEGSSVGMTIVHRAGELAEAIEKAFEYDREVLVERFVAGTEVTIGVLGNDDVIALPTLEIVPEHEFYDYDSKYVPGMSSHIIPARVSEEAREECQRLAVAAHTALGCRGMSRADTIVEADGTCLAARGEHDPGHDDDLACARCCPRRRHRVPGTVPDARGVRARAAR